MESASTRTVFGRGAVRLLLAAAGLAVLAGGAGCGRDKGVGEDGQKLLARVNGVEIPEGMVDSALGLFLAQRPQGAAQPSEEERAGLRRDMAEALISQELLLQKARSDGIEPNPGEVDRRLEGMQRRFGSKEAMTQALEGAGLTEEKVKDILQRNLQIDALLERSVRAQVQVDDAQVDEYFRTHPDEMMLSESVRASHILVMSQDGKATPEERRAARGRAEALLARVRKGEDFAAVARENSDDGSAQRGGDLGFFPRGRMTPNFENAAFALTKTGQLSGVVETPFGYHIIKLLARNPPRSLTLAEVRDKLRDHLVGLEAERKSKELLDKLKQEGKIERFDVPPEPAKG
jgi:peptidyl-prolyl cis-trans isomerase C